VVKVTLAALDLQLLAVVVVVVVAQAQQVVLRLLLALGTVEMALSGLAHLVLFTLAAAAVVVMPLD
jgi:hypothetical protein